MKTMPDQTTDNPVNPLLAGSSEAGSAAGQNQATQAPVTATKTQQETTPETKTVEEPVFVGKFKGVKALEEGYKNLEKDHTVKSQELALERKQREFLENQLNAILSAQKKPEPAQEMPPEEEFKPLEIPDDLWLENPAEANRRQIHNELGPILKKLEQKSAKAEEFVEYQSRVSQFNADLDGLIKTIGPEAFSQVQPIMLEIVEAEPHLEKLPNAVEIVYERALGRLNVERMMKDAPAVPVPEPAPVVDPLKDPALVDKILQDENLKKQIFAKLGEEIRKNDELPVVMGKQPGGASPAVEPTEIKSTKDATRSWLGFLRAGG